MNRPAHILICGEIGAGKSTLAGRLLEHNRRPVYGFVTKKQPPDENGICEVYIHPANAGSYRYSQENLIGTCGRTAGCSANPQVFETAGVKLLQAPPQGLLLMDELGFMESSAPAFCAGVLAAFDKDIPVLAVVKDKEIPFLQAVRGHKNTRLYHITPQNRDAVYEELLPTILAWNNTAKYL